MNGEKEEFYPDRTNINCTGMHNCLDCDNSEVCKFSTSLSYCSYCVICNRCSNCKSSEDCDECE